MLKSLPGDSLRPQVPLSQALHHFCSAPLCPCLWNAAWMLWPLLCMGPAAPSFLSISPVPELQGPVDKNGPRSSSSAPVGVLVSKPSPAFRADWGSLPSFSAQFSLLAFRAPLSTCLPSPWTCGPCTWPSSAQGRSWHSTQLQTSQRQRYIPCPLPPAIPPAPAQLAPPHWCLNQLACHPS